MKHLSDRAVDRLLEVADLPDLTGTRYRLVRKLGQGGMGTVYLVEDQELDREAALKVLSDPAPSDDFSRRLAREARHLARLEHPNIVPVHDVGRLPDGRLYYVMKYIRGQQLDRWSQDGPSRPETLRMFQKICEAVAFAHSHGVIHRDLKPENIMVGSFGEAVIMDFGIAKELQGPREDPGPSGAPAPGDQPPGGTAHGTVVGTPAYMAPEQARGQVDRIDERTDVYALGALLYSMLAGRPPGITVADTGEPGSDRWTAPAPLRRVAPAAPRPLESICLRAMSEDPGRRYASAREMAADVDRFLDGRPVEAHRETLVERAGRLVVRNKEILLMVLAYLMMRWLVLLLFPPNGAAPGG